MALCALSAVNIAFHIVVIIGMDPAPLIRAVSVS